MTNTRRHPCNTSPSHTSTQIYPRYTKKSQTFDFSQHDHVKYKTPCGQQGVTYQSLGWSLRAWRRASLWSQKDPGSRNINKQKDETIEPQGITGWLTTPPTLRGLYLVIRQEPGQATHCIPDPKGQNKALERSPTHPCRLGSYYIHYFPSLALRPTQYPALQRRYILLKNLFLFHVSLLRGNIFFY